jgi:hypothetical protein
MGGDLYVIEVEEKDEDGGTGRPHVDEHPGVELKDGADWDEGYLAESCRVV